MKVYLASPFFTPEQRQYVRETAQRLRGSGISVYVPMEHSIKDAWEKPNYQWSAEVFAEDVKAIREADRVIAITYGMSDDAGTSWEVGFSYGIGKPITVIAVNENTTYSLMVYQSANDCTDLDGTPIDLKTILQS